MVFYPLIVLVFFLFPLDFLLYSSLLLLSYFSHWFLHYYSPLICLLPLTFPLDSPFHPLVIVYLLFSSLFLPSLLYFPAVTLVFVPLCSVPCFIMSCLSSLSLFHLFCYLVEYLLFISLFPVFCRDSVTHFICLSHFLFFLSLFHVFSVVHPPPLSLLSPLSSSAISTTSQKHTRKRIKE